MKTAIEISNLTKNYKDFTAVDNINLDIFEGETFALLGPNGAGKTTLIKMLCCLTKPTSGTAKLLGYDIIKEELKVKEIIAVSPQETAIALNLSAYENLEMIAQICGKPKEKVDEMIKSFNLLKQAKMISKNLSGGNKRRLSIAMALITEPKILFLDEPTLGLDIEARYDLWQMIKKLKGNTTVILTTHYLEEADALSDRIGIIKNGKLIELGTSSQLKKKYIKPSEKDLSIDEVYLRIIRGEK